MAKPDTPAPNAAYAKAGLMDDGKPTNGPVIYLYRCDAYAEKTGKCYIADVPGLFMARTNAQFSLWAASPMRQTPEGFPLTETYKGPGKDIRNIAKLNMTPTTTPPVAAVPAKKQKRAAPGPRR
ncbi:MAG: hypothetical protein OXT65_01305 [Alphaproteobacteria bacterium]|nr:hypothetical protein [Alphaproteobacteria bacterium]